MKTKREETSKLHHYKTNIADASALTGGHSILFKLLNQGTKKKKEKEKKEKKAKEILLLLQEHAFTFFYGCFAVVEIINTGWQVVPICAQR